jgi:hypothetical protein
MESKFISLLKFKKSLFFASSSLQEMLLQLLGPSLPSSAFKFKGNKLENIISVCLPSIGPKHFVDTRPVFLLACTRHCELRQLVC